MTFKQIVCAKVAISVRADKPIIVCPAHALPLQNNIVQTIMFMQMKKIRDQMKTFDNSVAVDRKHLTREMSSPFQFNSWLNAFLLDGGNVVLNIKGNKFSGSLGSYA